MGAATFLETYAEIIPGSDIIAHCRQRHGLNTYEQWLQDPSVSIWLAGTATGAPVGYLVLTPATLPVDAPQRNDLEVQRIYVFSRFQAAGVGHALMNAALTKASQNHAPRLVLGVLTTNSRAVAFYKRQGFSLIDVRTFTVGKSIFSDSVMARSLG